MSNIFIFATSFVAKTLLNSADYLFKFNFDKIILLTENYNKFYFSNISSNINISYCDTVEDAIDCCDMVLLCESKNIPVGRLEEVKIRGEQYNKKVLSIRADFDNNTETVITPSDIDFDLSKCTVVINMATSMGAQQFCGELLLNQIMTKHRIAFRQIFSQFTRKLLIELESVGILKSSIASKLHFKDEPYDVVVIGVSFYGDLNYIRNNIDYIRELKPDYLILQTDFRFNSFDDIKNILNFKCNTSIDLILKSHYIQVNNLYPFYVHCNHPIEKTKNILDLEVNDIALDITFDMFSKITLPDGVDKL